MNIYRFSIIKTLHIFSNLSLYIYIYKYISIKFSLSSPNQKPGFKKNYDFHKKMKFFKMIQLSSLSNSNVFAM